MRSRHRTSALAALLATAGAVAAGASEPPPDYLSAVTAYADAMLERGRDTCGEQHSPLFASALDRRTMRFTELPAVPGVRAGDRSPDGANPQEETGLYRLLYQLDDITGRSRYAAAADEALGWFFHHCQSPATGLMAWGEHLYWCFPKDAAGGNDGKHEICGEWPFWDRCCRLAPDACWNFALGLWDHQVADHRTGDFSRHARWSRHGPGRGTDFPRYAGQMIATWADAYGRPENADRDRRPDLATAIEVIVGRMEDNMHASAKGYLLAGTDKTHRQIVWPASNLELARCLWKAAPRMDDELAARMRGLALRLDGQFHQLPHRVATDGGFVATIDSTSGEPRSRSSNRPFTATWETGYGHGIHAGMANLCHRRQRQLASGHPELASNYRALVLAAADRYLATEPSRDAVLKPAAFAEVIELLLAARSLTGRNTYLARADHFGRMSLELFLGDGLPLPRATNRHDHYETITGGPALMAVLLELHLALGEPTGRGS